MFKKTLLIICISIICLKMAVATEYNSSNVVNLSEIPLVNRVDLNSYIETSESILLPVEGEQATIVFTTKSSFEENITDSYWIVYYIFSPDSEMKNYGVSKLPDGPYTRGKEYITNQNYNFDVPGLWKVQYTIVNFTELNNINVKSYYYNSHILVYTKTVHVLSMAEAQNILSAQKSQMQTWISIISSFFAAIIGALATYIVMSKIERKKEKKQLNREIYAPLYDEIIELQTQCSSYSRYQSTSEWNNLKNKHLIHFIEQPELLKKLKKIYNSKIHNFFISGINAADKETINLISEKCNIKITDPNLLPEYLSEISMYLLTDGSAEYSYSAPVWFAQMKKNYTIKYNSLEELKIELTPQINKLESVKSLKKEQKQLCQELEDIKNSLYSEINTK